MVNDYDVNAAFKAIENELIASMIRNMDRHRAEESKKGYNWSMWQAEQLKSLEKYKRQNRKLFDKRFKDINSRIGEIIRQSRRDGNLAQEIQILKAIQRGYQLPYMPEKILELLEELDGKTFRQKASILLKKMRGQEAARGNADFFKLNDRKLEALIEATTHDMQRAETAVLRMANDQYRKIIFNAQVYANTGAGTYEKAVDMATKDMLAAGLNCVQYANGARHTMSDYADMALRTAGKRAYLQGEGEKRQEWKMHTVIINKRGNPCPKCLPFVGKVLIDDVWSGGKASDGPYPLMSVAIAAGLYHPRCKDSHTTYFPGISTADDTWTPEELEAVERASRKEAKRQYAERQADKFSRLAKYSLDPDNGREYSRKAEEWKRQSDYLVRSHTPGARTTRERIIANEAIGVVPEKVQRQIHSGTIIDVRKSGASQYDYIHDILYVAKGAEREDIIHEIGHIVENKILSQEKVAALRKKIVGQVTPFDVRTETYYDAAGNPRDIFILFRDEFVSEYQGRIYVDNIFDAFNKDGSFKDELLMEFVSESFREYIENPVVFQDSHKEFYDLMKEAVE